MYRVSSGFPGNSILRIGTIDDFHLQETKLKPKIEQFTKNRVSWLPGVEGIRQFEGSAFSAGKKQKVSSASVFHLLAC